MKKIYIAKAVTLSKIFLNATASFINEYAIVTYWLSDAIYHFWNHIPFSILFFVYFRQTN